MLVSTSFMHKENISGPSTVPWRTPHKTFFVLEVLPFNQNSLCCESQPGSYALVNVRLNAKIGKLK